MEKPTIHYSSEGQRRRTRLLPIVAVLFVLTILLQTMIDPTSKKMREGDKLGDAVSGLNNEFLLLPLLGFREAAAGLLWVRCDEFFHSGDYDAILPLVRLITWLDPHAENIFVTGAWHLSYNFTDSSERSDRRYISPSQRLLDEGIANNPNIPDIKFEKGWQNYDKIKDYVAAEKAFLSALAGPKGDWKGVPGTDDFPYAAPLKTLHILAHTYEKMGRIPEAVATWRLALERTEEMLKKDPKDYSVKQMRAAEQHNHDQALLRYRDRYTYAKGPREANSVNKSKYPAVIRPSASRTTPGPWDVSFQPSIEVTRPKVLKIGGKFNAADGARIYVRITDWDYKPREIGTELNNFEIDLSQTILMDSISVRKNRFEREMDMSKDPKMYSFSQPNYRIVLYFDPRFTSPHIQDQFGWSGEGMTDAGKERVYMDRNPLLMGTKLIEGAGGEGPIWDAVTFPRFEKSNKSGELGQWVLANGGAPQYGQPPRTIRVTYKVTKEQILGQKPITDADIIPNE